ncbi:MAG: hypothetical protein KJ646_05030 [Nanoarchaeota archaeon]|nr:hypothetical protein [Nanoarchaeota archaeon]MBU4116240.1 hypothetical protein [Nanoarchaeota archaeon]
MKKSDKFYLIIVFIFILSLVFFLFSFYLHKNIVLKKQEIFTSLMIGDKIGFDINGTALTFGMITPDSSSQRNISIENSYNFPIKVEFKLKGDIEEFLDFNKVVYLNVGEVKELTLYALVPPGSEFGNYSGIFNVVFKKHLF